MKLLTKLYNLKWYLALPIWHLILTAFIFGFYTLLGIGLKDPIAGTQEAMFKISLFLAIPFSLLFILMQSQMRKSIEFWDRSDAVEKEIDAAETLEELNRIVNEEFHSETGVLRKMASGPPHYQKMREMYKVIETKAKYVN
jgi:hypothetical protein